MPNRILKESICTSETICGLSPMAEIFFYRLIVNCDDYGRLDARPVILKTKCFPLMIDTLTSEQIESWVSELEKAKLILTYQFENHPYLQMVTWRDHQTVRAKKSKYPAPFWETSSQIQTDENICTQVQADENKCPRNPIQSNPIRNRNPIQSEEVDDEVFTLIQQEFISLTQKINLSSNDLKDISEAVKNTNGDVSLITRTMQEVASRAKTKIKTFSYFLPAIREAVSTQVIAEVKKPTKSAAQEIREMWAAEGVSVDGTH